MQTRRHFLGLSAALALPAVLRAQDPEPKKEDAPAITPETQKAIDAGLKFLALAQRDNGSFNSPRHPQSPGVAGLCGLAFLTGGHQPGQGPHGAVVSKIVKYLVGLQDPRGLLLDPRGGFTYMYSHGYALEFLTAVHGQLPDAKEQATLRVVLERALKLILQTQSPRGGWRYQPRPQDEDITHTALMLIVLRCYRETGFTVPKDTVDKAVGYIKRCHERNTGGFRYKDVGGPVRFSSTAVALAGLFRAGINQGPEVEKGLAYQMKMRPRKGENFFFYGHHYAAMAFWQAGGAQRAAWAPVLRKELLETNPPRPDGSWVESNCPTLGTALACTALQIPKGYLIAD
jgi:hypothetical protein